MRRPDLAAPPPEAVAQVTSGVADVLAALQAPEAAPVAPAPTPAAAPAESAAVAPPPPRPEAVAALAPPAAPEPTPASEPAPAEAAAPAPVPFRVVDAAGQTLAEPGDPMPDALAEADLPDDLPVPEAEDAEALPGTLRASAALVVPALVQVQPHETRRPRARPGEIVMTMASAAAAPAANTDARPQRVERTAALADDEPAATGEVVSRVSTSGGRHWAVTLGKFSSRGTAERALLQTALSETRALEGALRKVVQRGSAWEATFAGLTQDQADLACRRLQARAIGCFTLGP
jgi:D-alanyl-D-alanine carboxypeptidase